MTALPVTITGRAAAERLMVDGCTITRGTPGTVYDPETDTYVGTGGAVVYVGKCRVKPRDNADRQVEAGGETVSLWPYIVSIPMSATGIMLDDTITVSQAGLDPDLVGLVLRVRDVPVGSTLTARRLGCERSS